MIECNGSHVITHKHKHGNQVYRCTLANAKALLEQCLQNEAPDLASLAETLKTEPRPFRPFSWLKKALAEVRDMKESPTRLRMVLFGPGPKDRDETDPRPMPVITKAMQDELVLFFFRAKVNMDALDGRSTISVEALTECWEALSFLEPARQRIAAAASGGVLFIDDYQHEGYEELHTLLKDRWKAEAREESVVATFCQFFNSWGTGHWDVEKVCDA